GQPVDLGQAEVEDRRVVVFGRAEEMAVLAVGGQIHRVAGLLQRALELLAKRRLVLDDKDAHLRKPLLSRGPGMWAFATNASTGRPFPGTVTYWEIRSCRP